jgi:hypothetical protein
VLLSPLRRPPLPPLLPLLLQLLRLLLPQMPPLPLLKLSLPLRSPAPLQLLRLLLPLLLPPVPRRQLMPLGLPLLPFPLPALLKQNLLKQNLLKQNLLKPLLRYPDPHLNLTQHPALVSVPQKRLVMPMKNTVGMQATTTITVPLLSWLPAPTSKNSMNPNPLKLLWRLPSLL